jgi:hypothetical protein
MRMLEVVEGDEPVVQLSCSSPALEDICLIATVVGASKVRPACKRELGRML